MQTLYPIIRRVRRPLVETNAEKLKAETLKADRVEPVQPLATQPKAEGGAQGTARPTGVEGNVEPVQVAAEKVTSPTRVRSGRGRGGDSSDCISATPDRTAARTSKSCSP